MTINGIVATFHHIGIPSTNPRPGERYSPLFHMHTSDGDCKLIRVQWHRFEPDSELPLLLRTTPHVAFKVEDLERAITGYHVLLGPYEPIPRFRIAIIEDGGQPIELIETSLSDDEIWQKAETESILYSRDGENDSI